MLSKKVSSHRDRVASKARVLTAVCPLAWLRAGGWSQEERKLWEEKLNFQSFLWLRWAFDLFSYLQHVFAGHKETRDDAIVLSIALSVSQVNVRDGAQIANARVVPALFKHSRAHGLFQQQTVLFTF